MQQPVCIFGEVLFDCFPDGRKVLGGAPFNVAWHLQAFGLAPQFISRVGDDPEGTTVRQAMDTWGMDCSYLQTDTQHPTGQVQVTLEHNEPSYDIVSPCAYDAIALPDRPLPDTALLYHGSLAARHPASRATLQALVRSVPGGTVFVDVNLRPPWSDHDVVLDMIRAADWIKLNADELSELNGSSTDPVAQARRFLAENDLQGLVLTLGAAGAQVFTAEGESFLVRPAGTTTVMDTVGAGDAFASVVILGILSGWPMALTLQRAQAFASKIVGQRGATVAERSFYQPLLDEWSHNQEQ